MVLSLIVGMAFPAAAKEDVELLTEVPADVVWTPTEEMDGSTLGVPTPLEGEPVKALAHFHKSLQELERGGLICLIFSTRDFD